jgi:hypothetical protein
MILRPPCPRSLGLTGRCLTLGITAAVFLVCGITVGEGSDELQASATAGRVVLAAAGYPERSDRYRQTRNSKSRVDCVRVVGRAESVELWEPLGLANQIAPEVAARVNAYEKALTAYLAGDFDWARPLFMALAARDPPVRLFTQRIADLTRPPPGWGLPT